MQLESSRKPQTWRSSPCLLTLNILPLPSALHRYFKRRRLPSLPRLVRTNAGQSTHYPRKGGPAHCLALWDLRFLWGPRKPSAYPEVESACSGRLCRETALLLGRCKPLKGKQQQHHNALISTGAGQRMRSFERADVVPQLIIEAPRKEVGLLKHTRIPVPPRAADELVLYAVGLGRSTYVRE